MNHQACQCDRWPEPCHAAPAGTRGLCPACMPGNCGRALPAGALVEITHRAAGSRGPRPAIAPPPVPQSGFTPGTQS